MSVREEPSGPILVFDSGLGGLSVLARLREAIPTRRYIYIGDDQYFPYGARASADVISRVMDILSTALTQITPAAIVIACNTASTVVLPALRARFDIPIIGIVPAVKPAAARTQSGLVSVLTTPATAERVYLHDLIARFGGEVSMNVIGAPSLATEAEAALCGRAVNESNIRANIAGCFVSTAAGRRTDVIALGCTHFPFLLPELTRLAPWTVTWLDPAGAVARRTAAVLRASPRDRRTREPNILYLTGGSAPERIPPAVLDAFGLEWASLPLAPGEGATAG